jgi:alginate O-acetyltransferase complex protein AlgI
MSYAVPSLRLIVPVGLSFHTFQSLSYVVEVYRGRQRAEHDFGKYASAPQKSAVDRDFA